MENINEKNLDQFKKDTEETIKKEPNGSLIFDIQCRYGSIETDIISIAEKYGFDPKWSEEDKKIIENSESHRLDIELQNDGLEWLYEISQNAENYLNDLLEKVGIKGYFFSRISESEIWGLFPTWIDYDDDEKKLHAFWEWYQKEHKLGEEYSIEDIEVESYDIYGLTVYSIDGEEYAIGTDDDADNAALEYIKESVWAFNAEFIADEIGHHDLLPAIKALNEMCEDGNDGILALIEAFTTIDSFVESAISADGRGHFLSSYDGEEIEIEYANEYYYIYRIN